MALSVWGDHWSCGSEKSCKTPKATITFLTILCFLGFFLQDTTAVTHSLKYFYTGSSGVPNFPEFVSVGLIDDVQISSFDSNTQRAVPKQDWMNRVTEEDPEYWQRSTQKFMGHQQSSRVNTETLKQRFNQSGGVHLFQMMYGCEWDDESDEVNSGYRQFGYDGEDFLALDMKTMSWITPKQQAEITKHKWDKDRIDLKYVQHYHTKVCIEWLKKYLDYGRSSLMRKDPPSVSLLQKSPSSPITCHATGFYPNSAVLFWRKDGEELHEDVEHGEILPNHDGSFQMSVELKLPSEDWGKYECVFQLSGVKEDMVTKLEKSVIRTNHDNPIYMILLIVAAVILLSTIICVAGFFIIKKRNAKRPPSPPPAGEDQVMLQKT